jgi:hypothetical protein
LGANKKVGEFEGGGDKKDGGYFQAVVIFNILDILWTVIAYSNP